MKKHFTYVILTILVFVLSLTPVLAADAYSPDKVVDDADLLTSVQERKLSEKAAYVIKKYDCDIVILTVSSLGGKTAEDAADDYFDYNGYGIGSDRSGVLLLVSMDEREWHISTSGRAIKVFSDSNLDYIGDRITGLLSGWNYYEAFDEFIELCDDFLEIYETSESAHDTGNKSKEKRSLSNYILLAVMAGSAVTILPLLWLLL